MQPGRREASHCLLSPPFHLEPLIAIALPDRSLNMELQPSSDQLQVFEQVPEIKDEDATETEDDLEMHGLISSDSSISGSEGVEDVDDIVSIMNDEPGQINNSCKEFDSRGLCWGDRTALVDDVILAGDLYAIMFIHERMCSIGFHDAETYGSMPSFVDSLQTLGKYSDVDFVLSDQGWSFLISMWIRDDPDSFAWQLAIHYRVQIEARKVDLWLHGDKAVDVYGRAL